MRSLLSVVDLSVEELKQVLELAEEMKKEKNLPPNKQGYRDSLEGLIVGMLFEKPSTRTRISFEVAVLELGGHPLYMNVQDLQFVRGEPIKDAARVFSRYMDCLVARVFSHQDLIEFSEYGSIPVINALSDLEHPCQAVADLLTIKEKFGSLDGLKLAWVGDGNNVCNSLMLACSMSGIEMSVATPSGYEPDGEIYKQALSLGGKIKLTHDPDEAVQDADVVYTDVWVSMGQDNEQKLRQDIFKPYQINQSLLEQASSEVIVMHCLPAHRGEEIAEDVLEGEHSVIFEQAENRLYVQKALLVFLLKGMANV